MVPIRTTSYSTTTCTIISIRAKRVLTSGGRDRGHDVTSAAGVVATLVTYRDNDLSRVMAIAFSVIGARNSIIKLHRGSYVALHSVIITVVLTSKGSTTGTTTLFLNRDFTNFTSVVGGGTTILNVVGSCFIAPSKLSRNKRYSATTSVTILTHTTIGGRRLTGVYGVGDTRVAISNGGVRVFGRGGLLTRGNFVNIGANFAGGTKQYLISTCRGGNEFLIYIALGSPSS